MKSGQVPEVNLQAAPVDFKVYRFNQDWDVPRFNNEGTMHARGKYMDAADAMNKEFFFKKKTR